MPPPIRQEPSIPPALKFIIPLVLIALVILIFGGRLIRIVPAGHVAVATLFGKVQETPLTEGMHFPVNPLLQFTEYDVRERERKEEDVGIPTQDQLITQVDVSVKYSLDGKLAPLMLQETGDAERVIDVHLVPILRSVLREQGKTVKAAQDFFLPETQQKLQQSMLADLQRQLEGKGVVVEAVLLRDINLPDSVKAIVERKVQTEQEVFRQRAELERQRVEVQKQVVQAEAERDAAMLEAEKRKLLADAQAYEIEKINTAISNNPAYIQLEALKALMAISKDPAAKLYFLNSDSPMPLPLMHMGDPNAIRGATP
jgi:regulator of protease activity HflC (stomatin/prohibitin superfamily)